MRPISSRGPTTPLPGAPPPPCAAAHGATTAAEARSVKDALTDDGMDDEADLVDVPDHRDERALARARHPGHRRADGVVAHLGAEARAPPAAHARRPAAVSGPSRWPGPRAPVDPTVS